LLIEAARRGAKVRLPLDSFFNEPEANRSNQATVEYLAAIAAEGLLLRVGSLNGGEISRKVNREVVLMMDHSLVYDRLLEAFLHDWTGISDRYPE
jgi:hypothetical protein